MNTPQVRRPDAATLLDASGSDCWIRVGNLAVNVIRSDEGVVIDVWPHRKVADGPIASTFAFFDEASA